MSIKKKMFSKSARLVAIAISATVLSISLSFGAYAAWTGPSANPPGANTDTPLNVGATGQIKSGGLMLNTGGAVNGLIVDKGNVGIGAATPGYKLEVEDSSVTAAEHLLGGFDEKASGKGAYLGYYADGTAVTEARVRSGGNSPLAIGTTAYPQAIHILDTNGNVGIGTTTPAGRLDVSSTGAVTAANYGTYIRNLTTNTTLDGINKYGMYVTSTGAFAGLGGAATNNYGLYVGAVSGADNNYSAYFANNVGIGDMAPTDKLQITSTMNGYLGGVPDVNQRNATANDGSIMIQNVQPQDVKTRLRFVTNAGEFLIARTSTTYSIWPDSAGDAVFNLQGNSDNFRFLTVDPVSGLSGDRMIITADGKVGIGTSSPDADAKLHVYTNDPLRDWAEVRVQSTVASGGADTHYINDAGTNFSVGVDGTGNSGNFRIEQWALGAWQARMVINPSGRVGVGRWDPSAMMDVQMSTANQAEGVHIYRESSMPFSYLSIADEAFNTVFKVHENGNVGIGVWVPNQKLEVNGGVKLNTLTVRPACDATTRGTFWFVQGAAGAKDSSAVCAKDAADAYAWRTIY